MRVEAEVTTWAEVQAGDVILIGWPGTWREVTGIIVSPEGSSVASRYLRTGTEREGNLREYWARDEYLVTVRT